MNDANDNDDDDEYDMDDDDDIVIDSDDDDEVIIDDDDEVVCVGSGTNETMAPVTETEKEEEKKPRTLEEEIVTMDIGDEPAAGKDTARVQIRMPDGKRLVRKFRRDDTVKVIYAFVAQSSEEAKNGKSFILKAGFPPRDLSPEIENTIQNCGLAGESITARWS
mmetsp:Transcript_23546/g.35139  ORF Transcript_23546/g.35139 Transcript_23546/m.35139 type:complete len:164 (+) Transcript_23546:257-748(+)